MNVSFTFAARALPGLGDPGYPPRGPASQETAMPEITSVAVFCAAAASWKAGE